MASAPVTPASTGQHNFRQTNNKTAATTEHPEHLLFYFGLEITFFLLAGAFLKLREQTLFCFHTYANAGRCSVFRVPQQCFPILGHHITDYTSICQHGYLSGQQAYCGAYRRILPRFQRFISLEFVQIISPNMRDTVELDQIVLKKRTVFSHSQNSLCVFFKFHRCKNILTLLRNEQTGDLGQFPLNLNWCAE